MWFVRSFCLFVLVLRIDYCDQRPIQENCNISGTTLCDSSYERQYFPLPYVVIEIKF